MFVPEASAQASGTNFTVRLIYPPNQIESNSGYFYITDDKDTQRLQVNVKNITASDITVNIETASCFSSPTGDLVYIKDNQNSNIGYTDSRYLIEDNISPSAKEIKMKPYEERAVYFQISSPPADEGEAIGAVRFFESAGSYQNHKDNIQINIERSITIPVRIRLSDTAAPEAPAIGIGDASFDSKEGQLILSVSNNLAVINKNAKISYEVYDKSNNKLFEGNINLIKMAPKTFLRLPVKWEYPTALQGSYTVKVDYFISDTQTASTTKSFTIKPEQSDEYKNNNPSQPAGIFIKTEYLKLAGIIVALVIALLVILIKRIRKSK